MREMNTTYRTRPRCVRDIWLTKATARLPFSTHNHYSTTASSFPPSSLYPTYPLPPPPTTLFSNAYFYQCPNMNPSTLQRKLVVVSSTVMLHPSEPTPELVATLSVMRPFMTSTFNHSGTILSLLPRHGRSLSGKCSTISKSEMRVQFTFHWHRY